MRRFLLKLIRRRNLKRDLEAELAFHKEMAAASGNPIPLGDTTRIAEQAGDLWQFTALENLWRDLVYSLRALRRSPALVLTAVVCLALGIGPNAALFSLAAEFLLSEPSVTDAASLVSLRLGNSHAKPEVLEAVAASGVFAEVAGENEESFVNWNDGTETRRLFGVFTTKNYFTALGVPMLHGRGWAPSDPDEVAVLQHHFWRRHFNADPAVIGRAINLDGRACTILGVLPENHRTLMGYGYSPDVYQPRYLRDTLLAMYARLKPGMSIGQAQAGLKTVGVRLDTDFPERYWKYADSSRVSPIAGFARLSHDSEAVTIGLFFAMLLAVAGLVVLIACVNVAGLLLARASARRREIAIRLSLGAAGRRIVQQLLVESLVLSTLGAALGFVLAEAVASLAARIQLPIPIPIRLHIEPDWRVVLYAAFLAIISTLICGLLPALQAVRESISSALPREPRLRFRRSLVAAQIAVSIVVLTTGVLFIRNLMRSSAISPGFDLRHTVRADVNLPPAAYKGADRINSYVNRALEQLEALPGVEAAAAARVIPFTDATRFSGNLTFPDTSEQVAARFHWNAVTPGYFRAMDIPLRQGRAFAASDSRGPKVVVVSDAFVTRYLRGRSAVGRTFLWGAEGKTPYQIVGVVRTTKNLSIGEDDQPQLYEPLAQIENDRTRIQFVLRSATPAATQIEPARRALRGVEPNAGIEVATLYSSIGLAFLPS
jgi:predicted permease